MPDIHVRGIARFKRGDLKIFFTHDSNCPRCRYETSNIIGHDTTHVQDITCITLESNVYDLIICHRVLEHVADDMAALNEMYRILKPGGLLQISVPQSLHSRNTIEWLIPDITHHNHLRQYGADFLAKLESAGFKTRVNDWLLKQPQDELIKNGAFPFRFYDAVK